VQLILGHLGSDRRQFEYLVAEGRRVFPLKDLATPAAPGGLERLGAIGGEK
jgi:hypothetical protein